MSVTDRPDESKDPGTIGKTVEPGEEEVTALEVEQDGTLEDLQLRFYPGQMLSLRLRVVIRRNNEELPLIETAGKPFLDGDDDMFYWDTSRPVLAGDRIAVIAENVGDHPYDYRLNVDIDHYGGVERLISRFRRWL